REFLRLTADPPVIYNKTCKRDLFSSMTYDPESDPDFLRES
ncbi:unnamed protein product, partial [marine sediment metagenome]